MSNSFICDYVRTPIGKYAGALSNIRTDDLAAIPLRNLKSRYSAIEWNCLDDVIIGCANQAGEDNRNVARMSLLLAGFDIGVPGTTINRLCASGMDAIAMASRYIKSGEAELLLAGGVESMSRAPLVLPKDSWQSWLSGPVQSATNLCQAAPSDWFNWYRVTADVGKVALNHPGLVTLLSPEDIERETHDALYAEKNAHKKTAQKAKIVDDNQGNLFG